MESSNKTAEKTLQECKDQIAMQCSGFNGESLSYKDWQEMEQYLIENDCVAVLLDRADKTAELYAASQTEQLRKENASLRQQLSERAEEPSLKKEEKVKCYCPCHTDKNFKHVQPCCDNGYIDFPIFPQFSLQEQSPTVSPLHSRIKELEQDVRLRTDIIVRTEGIISELNARIKELEAGNAEMKMECDDLKDEIERYRDVLIQAKHTLRGDKSVNDDGEMADEIVSILNS